MRISVLDSMSAKSSSLNHLNAVCSSRPSDFYVRNRQISTKSKSPFRKYERAVRDGSLAPSSGSCKSPAAMTTAQYPSKTTTVTTTVTLPSSHHHTTTTTNSSSSNSLFTRKSAVDTAAAKSQKYRVVNTFEDLVITCVESGPILRDRNVVCYKKRYLVNMGGSHWNLHNQQQQASPQLQEASTPPSRSPVRCEKTPYNLEASDDEAKAALQTSQTAQTARARSTSSDEDSQCNRCPKCHTTIASTDNLAVKSPQPQQQQQVKTGQMPIGTPDSQQLSVPNAATNSPEAKKVRFDFDDDALVDNIELDPETAEQFIDLLILEDGLLRRKIADGDVDQQTLRKLERLTELRAKYIRYKEALAAERAAKAAPQLQQQPEQVDLHHSKSYGSSSSGQDERGAKEILIERMREHPQCYGGRASVAPSPPPAPAGVRAAKPIPVYHVQSERQQPSLTGSRCEPYSGNSASESSGASSSGSSSRRRRSRRSQRQGSGSSITSLRDSAFSHELKVHPLVQENSYLQSKLEK